MVNASTRVKVTREVPTGLTKIKADVIYIDDVFYRITMYYRYTGGFRPYLLDIAINACEALAKVSILLRNPAIKLIFSGVKDAFPTLLTGCPYKVRIFCFGS